MNRDLIFFAVGAAVGGAIGWFTCQRRCEAIVQKEIDEIKTAFGRPYGTFKKDIENVKEGMSVDLEATQDATVQTNYRKLVRRYDKAGAHYEQIAADHPVDSNEDEPIRVISVDDFTDDKPEFEKTTLYFYGDDEVLVNEDEEIQVDKFGLVGENTLESFGVESGDPEIVYARNEKLGVDYEIIRLSKSYAEAHGIDPIEDGDLDGND